ncbi:hypothetical protein QM012_005110 [Aureobasidium pullulans]|uniref:Multicopper oxidase, type 1 n=1 Tax=Aureobasidium pullulans TaxID=5580 RepID=A0ABR0T5K3_AURPU
MLGFNRGVSCGQHWTQVVLILFALSVTFALLDARFRWDLEISKSFKHSNTAHNTSHGASLPPLSSPITSETRLNIRLHPEDHATREPTTLSFSWRITSALQTPDGVEKLIYLINGQFPGPTIEARSGDRLVIEIENALDEPDTAIHWHGLQMRDANVMDGAVGITQASIAPGKTFTYNFTIAPSEHGTFWYHAHDHVQRADGLYGGLVVHQPLSHERRRGGGSSVPCEQLLLIGDWYHRPAEEVSSTYMSSGSFGNEPVPDSLLINGRGAYDCSMAVPARPIKCSYVERSTLSLSTTGKTKLRIVNVGSFAGIEVDLADFSMDLTAVDGGHQVTATEAAQAGKLVWPGQRADFVISPSSSAADSHNLTITLNHENFKYDNPALRSKHEFAIQYDISHKTLSSSNRQMKEVTARTDQRQDSPALKVDKTIVLYSKTLKLSHLANVPHGFINHTSWAPQGSPLIMLDRTQWNENQLVPHIPYNKSRPLWVDIVLNNLDEDSHSWHLHGYSFYVVAYHSADFGWGSYNPYVDLELPGGPLNLIDPPVRDTVYVPRRGYVVLRFRADNPGIWMFHCHMLWHQASGMALALEVEDGSLQPY